MNLVYILINIVLKSEGNLDKCVLCIIVMKENCSSSGIMTESYNNWLELFSIILHDHY